jgi:excisionase family DNA binding protein
MFEQERLLVTSKEAAGVLSISERTLFTLTAEGELPSVRVRGSVRYAWGDLQEYVSELRAAARNVIRGPMEELWRA